MSRISIKTHLLTYTFAYLKPSLLYLLKLRPLHFALNWVKKISPSTVTFFKLIMYGSCCNNSNAEHICDKGIIGRLTVGTYSQTDTLTSD